MVKVASEVWGSAFGGLGFGKAGSDRPFLGVRPDPDGKHFTIQSVTHNEDDGTASADEIKVISGGAARSTPCSPGGQPPRR